ncbi:MAG: Eco29kI family restriction endonuclease, partial [Terriglobia bacterium]
TRGRYKLPIYVGKAVPPGGRKGGFGLGKNPGQVLYRRLVEHAESIEQATNLRLQDFGCRYLVVEDIWIPLGEQLLIEWFSPIWNKIVDGFGNHPPGGPRGKQKRSRWDTVHPGRPWANTLPPNPKTTEQVLIEVTAFLSGKTYG